MDQTPELTPYSTGDHCVFYGIQDANWFFNHMGLSVESRDRLKAIEGRRDHLNNMFGKGDEVPGGTLLATLPIVLVELEKLGIGVETAYCTQSAKDAIEAHATLRRFALSYELGNDFDAEFPLFFFYSSNEPNQPGHVWFAGNYEDYANKYKAHTEKHDHLDLVLTLKKKTDN